METITDLLTKIRKVPTHQSVLDEMNDEDIQAYALRFLLSNIETLIDEEEGE